VLILAAEHAYQKTVIRKIAAQIFKRPQVRFAHRVSGQLDRRVHLVAHADHGR